MNSNDPANIPAPFSSIPTDFAAIKRVSELGQTLPYATGGRIPAPLTAADLSAKHIGERVRITNRADVHTGFVCDIRFLTESTYDGASAVAVEVTFRDGTITYPLNADATVLT